jgi:phosphoribosylanthranilate isomerase
MSLVVKICGLSTVEAVNAAVEAGADMLGFVFFPPSPRHIGYGVARELAVVAGSRALKVALTVDADDTLFDAMIDALAPDILQLHGHETPERVAAIRRRFGLPVMKAIGIATLDDLGGLARYAGVADRVLLDAKPPKEATRPGGNARAFDWSLLGDASLPPQWMLSGGLDIGNIAEAIRLTAPPGVDVSSGVESAPGVKNPNLIRAFIKRARAAAR